MFSIFEHTEAPVCVHILHDATLTERNRSFFTETAENFAQKIEFHDISTYMGRLGDETIQHAQGKRHSVGTMFRLLIPEVLPLEKVIYLDCDIVIDMDIRELWEIPLDDFSIAGVRDVVNESGLRLGTSNAYRWKLIGCDPKTYINSGVMLMNLTRIRQKFDLTKQYPPWFNQYKHLADMLDQDFINWRFLGDIKLIDNKFNNYCGRNNYPGGSIMHAINTKPWNGIDSSGLDRLYWKSYLKTPWGRVAPEEVVDKLFNFVRDSPYMHRRTSQCFKRIYIGLRSDILRNTLFKIVSLWVKNSYYRLLDKN
ncbi:MAG: hypothetical protein FWF29_12805 [Treponema sp.]|nr:hypothetical protein [Treponema sp.]